jgi:hypothetical protein
MFAAGMAVPAAFVDLAPSTDAQQHYGAGWRWRAEMHIEVGGDPTT